MRAGFFQPFVRALTLFAVLSLVGCTSTQFKREIHQFSGDAISNPSSEPVLDKPRRLVATVVATSADGKRAQLGTGFFLRADQVVTCLHVIESAAKIDLVLPDGTMQPIAGIFGSDPLNDLAVLWTTNAMPGTEFLRLRPNPAEPGETAFALGAPPNLPISAAKGTVTEALSSGSDLINSALVLSVPEVQGFSGGPVLDARGEVLGVAAEILYSRNRRVSVAVPAEELVPLLNLVPESFSEWRSRNPPPDPRAAAFLSLGDEEGIGRELEALKHYDRAIGFSPKYTRAWVRRGACLMRLYRLDEAAAAFRAALEIEPGLISPRVRLIACLILQQRFTEVVPEADRVLILRPEAAVGHMSLAAARLGLLDFAGALEAIRAGQRLASDRRLVNRMAGELWDFVGLPERSIPLLRTLLDKGPQHLPSWHRVGTAEFELGHPEAARDAFRHLTAGIDSRERAGALYFLHRLAARAGDAAEAQRLFGEFLAAEQTNQKRSKAPAHLRREFSRVSAGSWRTAPAHRALAELFRTSQRQPEHLAALEAAVALEPSNARTWSVLARACCLRWRFNRGEEAALKAIALNERDAMAHQSLGIAQGANGRLDDARRSFLRAAELEDSSFSNYVFLACVERRAGDAAKSAAYLEEARRRKMELPASMGAAWERLLPDASAVRDVAGP